MSIQPITKQLLQALLNDALENDLNVTLEDATYEQIYIALSSVVRDILSQKHRQFISKTYQQGAKQVYYLCMEFLLGRSLRNGLTNLGISSFAEELLTEAGINIASVYKQEPDAGLGNGGLGRLAACYLDGMATNSLPGTGYSILYEYGIFKQHIVDGWQEEQVDDWLPRGDVWLKEHPHQAVEIKFGGDVEETFLNGHHIISHKNYESVFAVPNDMYISGYQTNGVSKLRLFSANSPGLDMESFNKGDYSTALNQTANAELISKILYPNDNQENGKKLRLRQQYFMSAAAVADILRNHSHEYGTFDNIAEKVSIQLNDTHPTLAILEFMRILMDDCGYSWHQTLTLARSTFSYTNHTVMSEALEKWDEHLFKTTLPRLYAIARELHYHAQTEFRSAFPDDEQKIKRMSLIENGEIHMANICVYVCHSVNGVSKLHSDIIKQSVFHDYYLLAPQKFKNVTNGIAYRRWLLEANPKLTTLIDSAIGPAFKKDATALSSLLSYTKDQSFLQSLHEVKQQNKVLFSNYYYKQTGTTIDPASVFNVQVKRIHEYKRQHLNALHITAEYLFLKANPQAEFLPKTYIFGGKAAPGYYMAKEIIRYIVLLGKLIDADHTIKNKLRIVFLENYSVTTSELLMPASEISEQISLAGTEASGTGNMKFMLNGAVTIGTRDGANVEIEDVVGAENFVRFGMLTSEVAALRESGYHPQNFLAANESLSAALQFMQNGFHGQTFEMLFSNLCNNDPFMVLADFTDYCRAQAQITNLYKNRTKFAKMSLVNIANAGIFSADRSVQDYASRIWHMKPVQ